MGWFKSAAKAAAEQGQQWLKDKVDEANGARAQAKQQAAKDKAAEKRREGERRARLKASATTSGRGTLVEVKYVDFWEEPRGSSSGYTFVWKLKAPAVVGARIVVPGMDGNARGVVTAVNVRVPKGYRRAELSSVSRTATPLELERAAAKVDRMAANEQAWLDMARRAVGLATPGRRRASPPAGYDPIPPFDGDAEPSEANLYCSQWWALFKAAERTGRPEEEIKAFKQRAHRWAAVRDRNAKRDVREEIRDTDDHQ